MIRKLSSLPWVFWINISIRREWFSYWWKTRGSNFAEYQVWIFKISIGRPWLRSVVESKIRDYGGVETILKTNEANLKNPISILIKPSL
jgi:hypothetical protein